MQEGIRVEKLSISNFQLKGLYLKLDKKLILTIDYLHIPKMKKSNDIENPKKQIKELKLMLGYFQHIELKDIIFTNNHFNLLYADNMLYIKNNDYEVAGTITAKDNYSEIDAPLIYISKYALSLNGKLKYHYDSEKIEFLGAYSILGIDGNLSLQLVEDKINFSLSSTASGSISGLLDMLKISEDTREWIDRRVLAKGYKINALRGSVNHVKNKWVLDDDSLYGKVTLSDVSIKFKDKLKPINAKSSTLVFDSKGLDINLTAPLYGNKQMQGSTVSITNVIGEEDSIVSLKLYFYSQIDKEIKDILEAYDISLPISQEKGVSKAYIALAIPMSDKPTKVNGRVLLSKGNINIGGIKLSTAGGEVTFDNKIVSLWNVEIHDNWYKVLVNGHLNLHTKKAKFKLNLKKLLIGNKKNTHIYIKNKKSVILKLDYNNKLIFDIPTLKLHIKQNPKAGITIISKDAKAMLSYTKNLPIKVSGGDFRVSTKDYKRYNFSGHTNWKHSYIYNKKGKISAIPFSGRTDKRNTYIKVLGGKLVYNSKNSSIKMHHLNINLKKALSVYAKRGKNNRNYKKNKRKYDLKIHGQKCLIRYEKHILLSDVFDMSIDKKGISFKAIKDGDRIMVKYNDKYLSVNANKIKDRMLSSLINFNGMRGGRYSFELSGVTDGTMIGKISVLGGAIRSFKVYNDIIALFNTIPALMTFSDPGFSDKGYIIRDGKIDFELHSNRIDIDNLYINGKSATVAGQGVINLNTKRMDMDLAIHTARELGQLIGSLPLVGYILFGKDKSLTTGIKITGTVENPIVKTNTVKDILLSPLEFIKRTISSPAHIIND